MCFDINGALLMFYSNRYVPHFQPAPRRPQDLDVFAAQLKELGLPGAAASRSSAQANGSSHAIAQVRSCHSFHDLIIIGRVWTTHRLARARIRTDHRICLDECLPCREMR